jgi:hypothetical protein
MTRNHPRRDATSADAYKCYRVAGYCAAYVAAYEVKDGGGAWQRDILGGALVYRVGLGNIFERDGKLAAGSVTMPGSAQLPKALPFMQKS